ncbi:MAG: hypothetical protein E7333_01950 [Clostridiales bacterium]|nr:hypothetical protein [Clostridiales bacterium]
MMKKIARLMMVLLVMSAVLMTAALAEFGLVTGSGYTNLRQSPSGSGGWLGSYVPGTWMEIIGEQNGFYQVKTPDGKQGYMSTSFVRIPHKSWGAVGIVNNPKATSYLNLRQSPSYTATVLGQYYNGVPCRLISRSNGWYNVELNGQWGYFREEYIRETNMTFSGEVATVQTADKKPLNLRQGPGYSYNVVKKLQHGSYVMVLARGNDWCQVSVEGAEGFVDASFLKDEIIPPVIHQQQGTSATQSTEAYALVNNPKPTQVLNFRQSASTTSRVLGQYMNGAKLWVLAQGTEWCQVVNQSGVAGYMMTEYLSLNNLPSIPYKTVMHPDRTFVYLRSEPMKNPANIQATVPHGDRVVVLVPGDIWTKVLWNGHAGYMMSAFLK